MRVISGKYKGRNLKGFNLDGTRPTMDRIKESLFGIIQNDIKGSTCLDLFAGSGALGIEALSNGALSCDFVDNSIEAINTIKYNLKGIDNYSVMHMDYKKFIKSISKKYDVVFLDPPYDSILLNKSLKFIEEYDLLENNGIIVCEYEKIEPICSYDLIKDKKYGSKKVKIFRKA